MGIRNGIQTNTRPFFITFIIIGVFLIGSVCSSVFADVNQRQSTNVLVDNGEVALSLEDTNKGVRFKLEKNSSEALQFSVNLIDSKGEKIPLMIDDQPIAENQVLTEEQFSTLHFTKPTEPVRLFIKYKSANGTLTDLTPPEGEILPLVEPENNDQSGTSGSQPTEVTSGTIEENSETGENQETTETQQATSEAEVAEEQSSTSSDYRPPRHEQSKLLQQAQVLNTYRRELCLSVALLPHQMVGLSYQMSRIQMTMAENHFHKFHFQVVITGRRFGQMTRIA